MMVALNRQICSRLKIPPLLSRGKQSKHQASFGAAAHRHCSAREMRPLKDCPQRASDFICKRDNTSLLSVHCSNVARNGSNKCVNSASFSSELNPTYTPKLLNNCTRSFELSNRRFFFKFSPKNKIKEYSERRILGYSMRQMYDVVAGVQDYKQFVPYCTKSTVTERKKGFLRAELEVGFPPVAEAYTSSVSLAPPHMVRAVCTQGRLFNSLLTVWRFSPAHTASTCTLDFSDLVRVQVGAVLAPLPMVFDELVRQNVSSFLREAEVRYGPPSMQHLPPLVTTLGVRGEEI